MLKPTGSSGSTSATPSPGTPATARRPRDCCSPPSGCSIALAADGWIVRNKVIWAKTNPMPTSVGDRLTLTYEVVYFLVRSPALLLRSRRHPGTVRQRWFQVTPNGPARKLARTARRDPQRPQPAPTGDTPGHPLGKNPGDVWRIATRAFAAPTSLPSRPRCLRRPLLSTCPEGICTACGPPWRRTVTLRRTGTNPAHAERTLRRTYPDRWRTERGPGTSCPAAAAHPPRPAWCSTRSSAPARSRVVAREHRPRLARDRTESRLHRTGPAAARPRPAGSG